MHTLFSIWQVIVAFLIMIIPITTTIMAKAVVWQVILVSLIIITIGVTAEAIGWVVIVV